LAVSLQLPSTVAADPAPKPRTASPCNAWPVEQIKARVQPIDDQKLIAGALSGVLKGLDPRSVSRS
jgi:hypothetical protein